MSASASKAGRLLTSAWIPRTALRLCPRPTALLGTSRVRLYQDSLFDTVKSQVEHLVVYLTREVLTRPWCAGEIATSVKKGPKIKITKVRRGLRA